MSAFKILLVDDSKLVLKALSAELENRGFYVETVDNGSAAISMIKDSNYDVVISDLVMENVDGLQVLEETKKISPNTSVIILTGHGDLSSAVKALRRDADDYLLKPWDIEALVLRILKCLSIQEAKYKNRLYERILPICANCNAIRDDRKSEPGNDKWMRVEKFLQVYGDWKPSNSICPDCSKKEKERLEKEG